MNLNLKYSNIVVICIFQMMSAGFSRHHRSIFDVGWLKLADIKDSLSHLTQMIFGVGRHQLTQKIDIFYITQRV
jgi:hypothetical protein